MSNTTPGKTGPADFNALGTTLIIRIFRHWVALVKFVGLLIKGRGHPPRSPHQKIDEDAHMNLFRSHTLPAIPTGYSKYQSLPPTFTRKDYTGPLIANAIFGQTAKKTRGNIATRVPCDTICSKFV